MSASAADRPGPSRRLARTVALLCCLAVVTVAAAGVAVGDVDISIRPAEADVPAGEERTFELVVEGADEGVGAYGLTVQISDDDAATLENLTLTGDPGLDGGQRVNNTTASVFGVMGEGNHHDPAATVVIAELTAKGRTAGASADLFVAGSVDVGAGADTQYTVDRRSNATIAVVLPDGDSDDTNGGVDDGGGPDSTDGGVGSGDDGDHDEGDTAADDTGADGRGDDTDGSGDVLGPGFGLGGALAALACLSTLLARARRTGDAGND